MNFYKQKVQCPRLYLAIYAPNAPPDIGLYKITLAGRINKITDPLQFITRIERNNLDQTTKIIDANLGETNMAYNAKHKLANVTDPLNQGAKQYTYCELTRTT